MNRDISLDRVIPITELEVGQCRFSEGEDGRVMKTCPADVKETPKVEEYRRMIEEQQKLLDFFMDNFQMLSENFEFFRMIDGLKGDVSDGCGDGSSDGTYKLHVERDDGSVKRSYDIEITDKGLDGVFDGIKVTGESDWAALRDDAGLELKGTVAELEGEQFHPLIVDLVNGVMNPLEPSFPDFIIGPWRMPHIGPRHEDERKEPAAKNPFKLPPLLQERPNPTPHFFMPPLPYRLFDPTLPEYFQREYYGPFVIEDGAYRMIFRQYGFTIEPNWGGL